MSHERWPKKSLGEVVHLKRGFDLPTSARSEGPYPVVGSAGVSGWHFEKRASGPGVTLGRSGSSMGNATYCPGDFWPLNTTLFVEDFLGNEPYYVYHLLRTIDFTAYNSGSAQPSLNRNYIENIRIPVAPRGAQIRISELAGALDKKIAANERVARTSEELIEALFSPDRSNKQTKLENLCTLRKEQVKPTEVTDPVVAHFSLPAYDADRTPEYVSPCTIKSAKFLVNTSAVLLSKLNPEIPRIWNMTPEPGIPALASTEFLVLEPRKGVSTSELWGVTRQRDFLESLTSKVTGTSKSHQRVRPVEVMTSTVVDPRAFNNERGQAEALSRRAAIARLENRSLTQLRDTLLPKLISGELRIKDAEKQVEDAV
ncbi:restriction endonuclease subunit S [Streptomyces macrosporus]|uniref:Restriction endonuclease subunit S n=1 Tax=Streptomyces macrosporus TaxID=44032 RepID=A0ABN3JVU5_9ACTN